MVHSCSPDEWRLKRRHKETPERWPSFSCEIEHSITLTPSLKSQRSRTKQQLNPKSPPTADHNSYTHPLADWEAYVQGVQIKSGQVVTTCRTTPNWQVGHREHSTVCFQTMLVNLYRIRCGSDLTGLKWPPVKRSGGNAVKLKVSITEVMSKNLASCTLLDHFHFRWYGHYLNFGNQIHSDALYFRITDTWNEDFFDTRRITRAW